MKKSLANPERVYLDANVFIYADIASDVHGDSSRKIIEFLLERKFRGVTCALTIDEVIWSIWQEENKRRAVKVGKTLLEMANLELLQVGSTELQAAIDSIEEYNLKPRDAIHYAEMIENNANKIVSSDPHFDEIQNIERIEIPKFAKELEK